jgi:alkanesulfonate monooxygenase SsuD/methylene tetrahydromethanopterin reductase-like flavin-dependent oxidoreductase (luciferase family)
MNRLELRKSSPTASTQKPTIKLLLISSSGEHLRLSARHQLHSSPQRTPVIFQGGTSKSGMAFAARHVEAIYTGGMVSSHATAQIKVSPRISHLF